MKWSELTTEALERLSTNKPCPGSIELLGEGYSCYSCPFTMNCGLGASAERKRLAQAELDRRNTTRSDFRVGDTVYIGDRKGIVQSHKPETPNSFGHTTVRMETPCRDDTAYHHIDLTGSGCILSTHIRVLFFSPLASDDSCLSVPEDPKIEIIINGKPVEISPESLQRIQEAL